MAKKLTDTEIKQRLQQLRNVTMLHARAMAKIAKLEALLKARHALLVQKDARILELETKRLDKESQRQELAGKLWRAKKDQAKAAITRDLAAPLRSPGAQPGHEAHQRAIPPESAITDRAVFDLSVCPSCKNTVGEMVDKVEKYQEDIDLSPRNKIVRHYTITRHWCSHCQEYVRPVNTPAQNLRRFGPNVVGYILYARYRLRLPLLKIQESLADLHDFTMSVGEIQNQLNEARDSFGEQYDLICKLIRSARVVYADESGWQMDGDNWYIWAFVDKESGAIRYELVDTRGGVTARDALGHGEDQVIVSDGYAVYDSLPGSNQQCWVHLLRVAKSKSTAAYGELCKLYAQLLIELEKPVEQRDKQKFDDELITIQAKAYKTEPLAKEVQDRITRHHAQLLVCLDHENVLPENNTAERAIRTQVILRKIFGGNRSPTGAKTHAVNTSVVTTKLNQNPGKSFFEVMVPLIQEAHSKPKTKPATT
jgi:transposase